MNGTLGSLRGQRLLRWGSPLLAFAVALAILAIANRSPSIDTADPIAAGGAEAAGLARTTPERIATLRAGTRQDPANAATYAALGDAYYQRGRETGEPRWSGRAESAYEAALLRDPREVTATVGLATVALARHDFARGLELAREARKQAPRLVRPYPALVDARIELGRYAAAARTLDRMLALKPTLAAYSRLSYFRELNGDLPGAIEAMRLAVSAGGGTPESAAYVRTLLGDLELLRGDYAAAERLFRESLTVDPGYAPALEGLAEIDAATGRSRPALRRYRDVVERLPLLEHVIALGEAAEVAGRDEAAERHYARAERQAGRLLASGAAPEAEMVHFEADHGQIGQAVELGRQVWKQAPSVTSADAYSWAVFRDGRIDAALRLSHEALRLESVEPEILYHAGAISLAAGRAAEARALLGRLVGRGPSFDPAVGPSARALLRRAG
jgi:tetratricopeptide (TPR) repeat protein